MRKMLTILFSAALALCLITGPAQAQGKFSFKVTGGLAYASAADINNGLQGLADLYETVFVDYGWSVTNGYAAAHLGMDFGAEFSLEIAPNVSVGLGVGYLKVSKSSHLDFTYGSVTATQSWAPQITAIPITLTFYYDLPVGPTVKVTLHGGLGYYLAKYKDTQHIDYFGVFNPTADTSANGLGFHGGIGLEFQLTAQFGLLLEARGRYAAFGNVTGTNTWSGGSTTGKLYFYEFEETGYGWFPAVGIWDTTPSGAWIRNVREAKIDFNGFSLRLGFVVHI